MGIFDLTAMIYQMKIFQILNLEILTKPKLRLHQLTARINIQIN